VQELRAKLSGQRAANSQLVQANATKIQGWFAVFVSSLRFHLSFVPLSFLSCPELTQAHEEYVATINGQKQELSRLQQQISQSVFLSRLVF
jgi:hypothetical protein